MHEEYLPLVFRWGGIESSDCLCAYGLMRAVYFLQPTLSSSNSSCWSFESVLLLTPVNYHLSMNCLNPPSLRFHHSELARRSLLPTAVQILNSFDPMLALWSTPSGGGHPPLQNPLQTNGGTPDNESSTPALILGFIYI